VQVTVVVSTVVHPAPHELVVVHSTWPLPAVHESPLQDTLVPLGHEALHVALALTPGEVATVMIRIAKTIRTAFIRSSFSPARLL